VQFATDERTYLPKDPAGVICGALQLCHGGCVPTDFLQNCSLKIMTKVDHNQTGFIRGRSISETFVYATGLVKVCHKRRLPALVLKLDFAKAFDTVNWDGLFRVLRVRGFSKTWVGWMLDILAQS
jgi:hypothetical protein